MKRLLPLFSVILAIVFVPNSVPAGPPNPKPGNPKVPPARPNVQPLITKLNNLYAQIQKLRVAAVPKLVKAIERYHAELNQLRKVYPPGKLEGEVAQLRHAERAQIRQTAVDQTKANAIQAAYKTQRAELEAEYAPKQADIDRLTSKRNAEIEAVQKKWYAELAKINPPENKLETRLFKAIQEERAAMHKLLDQTKAQHADVIKKYNDQVSALQQKLQTLEAQTQQANKDREQKIAAVESELKAQLNQLDPPDNRLADRVALVKAQSDARRASATTDAEKKSISAEAAAEIKALEDQSKSLREDIRIAKDVAKVKIQGFDEEYRTILAAYNPVEDPLDAQINRVRASEAAEIMKLVDPAKIQAIRTEYKSSIADLERSIMGQDKDRARLTNKMETEVNNVNRAYDVQVNKLVPPADRLSMKLYVLAEKEYAELLSAQDPAKVAAIRAEFHPKFQRLAQLIEARNQQFIALAQRHHQEMNAIMQGLQVEITPILGQIEKVQNDITKALR